jgi:hypothetical protein
MAHSVLLLGASGARGRGGGVGCRCWVGLLIRCRCWAGAAAEGEGAVDGWSRLVLLLGCGWWRWWLATLEPTIESYGGCGAAGLLKAVPRRGVRSMAVVGVDVEWPIVLWNWCAGLLGGGLPLMLAWGAADGEAPLLRSRRRQWRWTVTMSWSRFFVFFFTVGFHINA